MKKRFFLLVCAAGLVFALCGCAGADFVPKPEAEISRFDIDSLSLRDITFVFDIDITNPYPVGLKLDAVKTDFFVEGKQAFSATNSGGFDIPAKGRQTTSLLVTLKYADVIGIVSDYASRDYLTTLIKTEILIPLPEIPGLPPSLKFSYDLEKRIPAVKPRVSIANFHVQQPSAAEISEALKAAGKAAARDTIASALGGLLSGKAPAAQTASLLDIDLPLTVSFDIQLANETAAALDFAGLDYGFAINGNPLVEGFTRNITRKDAVSLVSVINRFSTKNLTAAIIDAFKTGAGEYSLRGKTDILFPEEIRKTPVPLQFTEGGEFNLR
ncbi:MAG: LEA type 2 family protein [Spirochaetia bacterium]|jgi:LEA14-like dessication related protein|nr:LEA type 2 family protein [Spirochaetia bacterium]